MKQTGISHLLFSPQFIWAASDLVDQFSMILEHHFKQLNKPEVYQTHSGQEENA